MLHLSISNFFLKIFDSYRLRGIFDFWKKKQRVQKQPNSESHYNQKKNAYIRTGLWIGLSPLQTPSTALCVWQGFFSFFSEKTKKYKRENFGLLCFQAINFCQILKYFLVQRVRFYSFECVTQFNKFQVFFWLFVSFIVVLYVLGLVGNWTV